MTAYYNEIDPFKAQWLRNLIEANIIAPGEVDERSIEEVEPDDLKPFRQCHFFAGIGLWSVALRQAGWGDEREVWTGSCPCQPWSAIGRRGGEEDDRHLWPAWFELIKARPGIPVFGEQVANGGGQAWLDIVQADLEEIGYTCAKLSLCAAGFGAPTIRDRTFWLGYADSEGLQGYTGNESETARRSLANRPDAEAGCDNVQPGMVNGYWAESEWRDCADGKARPIQPGTFPMANGVPCRDEQIHAYGDGINVETARHFIVAGRALLRG